MKPQQPTRAEGAPSAHIEGLVVRIGYVDVSPGSLIMEVRVVGAGTSAPFVHLAPDAAEAFARGLEHLALRLRAGDSALPVASTG